MAELLLSELTWRTSCISLGGKGEDGERSIRKTQFSSSFLLFSTLCATCTSEGGPVLGKHVRHSCHLPKPVCCDPSMGHFNYSSPPPLSLCCIFLVIWVTQQVQVLVITHPKSFSVSNSMSWPFFHLEQGLSGPRSPACLTRLKYPSHYKLELLLDVCKL